MQTMCVLLMLSTKTWALFLATGIAMMSQQCMLGDLPVSNGKGTSQIHAPTSRKAWARFIANVWLLHWNIWENTKTSITGEWKWKFAAIKVLEFAHSACPCKNFALKCFTELGSAIKFRHITKTSEILAASWRPWTYSRSWIISPANAHSRSYAHTFIQAPNDLSFCAK